MATMMVSPAFAKDGHDQGKHKGAKHSKQQNSKHSNQKARKSAPQKIYRRSTVVTKSHSYARPALTAREWRRMQDGTRYQTDGRYVYYNGSRYNSLSELSRRRQQTKNEWRNIAYVGGAVALLGLLKHDNRLVFAGAAGGLYALWRYEQDRKSQSKIDRLRASYFSRPYFVRDGKRYDRRIVTKNGTRYYQFVRR
jgi:hypothetical protein